MLKLFNITFQAWNTAQLPTWSQKMAFETTDCCWPRETFQPTNQLRND